MSSAILSIQLLGYWHTAGGRSHGALADVATYRDTDGLPALPGRHLKGLLREALRNGDELEWLESDLATTLFGPREAGNVAETGRKADAMSRVRVTDARLPQDERETLLSPQGARLIPHLFRTLYSTAIEPERVTAREHSLRGIEVAVPLLLEAHLEPMPGADGLPSSWRSAINRVLSLVPAVGGYRRRGLGRCRLTLKEVET